MNELHCPLEPTFLKTLFMTTTIDGCELLIKLFVKSIDVKENDGFQNVIGFNFSNFSEQLDTYVET